MQTAELADIHGNRPALRAVLAELDAEPRRCEYGGVGGADWVTALFEHGAGRGEPPGEPGEGVLLKELEHLAGHRRALIAHSPFVVVSTAPAAGQCDASPRGAPPGFVTVLDHRRLAFADSYANRL